MTRDTSANKISFVCYCGNTESGNANDVLIASAVLHHGDTESMYEALIKVAAFDPTNKKVKKDCPECGLDYMTQIRIGTREVVVWVCKCGYNSLKVKLNN
jgi:hypothetical protein